MYSKGDDFRIVVSFTTAVAMHLMVLFLLNTAIVKQMQQAKIITNVELLDIVEDKLIVKKKSMKPADIWKMIVKKTERKSEPIKMMEKLAKKEKIKEMEKLIDKTDELKRKKDMPIEQLKKERDEKLAELMKMTEGKKQNLEKLISQETQMLKDKAEPIKKFGDDTIKLAEVGTKRAKNADAIISMEAAAKKKNKVRDMTHLAQLVDKKAKLKERLMIKQQGSIQLKDSQVRRSAPSSITQVVGTTQQRQVARELIAIQSALEEETDTRSLYEKMRDRQFAEAGAKIGRERQEGEIVKIEKRAMPAQMAEKESAIEKMKRLGSAKISKVDKSPVEITGPLKNRKIKKAFIPDYPVWARKQGIEAEVSLRFFVDRGGKVIDDIVVLRTSGYKELDHLSIEALKKWIFAPLERASQAQDQWGIITFKFRLE